MTTIMATDGTELFTRDWGDGPAVVFSHGWSLNSTMWDRQIQQVSAAGFRCVAHDRRGHGRSDLARSGYDLDTFASDLGAVIDTLLLGPVVLVAHSSGAGEAIRLATGARRSSVMGLALVGATTPFLGQAEDNPDGLDPAMAAATGEALVEDRVQWLVDGAPGYFAQGEAGAFDGLSEHMRWTLRQILDTPLEVAALTSQLFFTDDLRSRIGGLDVPTLVVHGDADQSAPIDLTGRRTAALAPHGRLEVYEGDGHGLYVTHGSRLSADIVAFASEAHARIAA